MALNLYRFRIERYSDPESIEWTEFAVIELKQSDIETAVRKIEAICAALNVAFNRTHFDYEELEA
jgi:hypothetical protein